MNLPPQPWQYTSNAACTSFLASIGQAVVHPGWCPGLSDEVLCWPATPPGTTAKQLCPPMAGVDRSKFAQKTCNPDGKWWNKFDEPQNVEGYTNYDPCFTEATQVLLNHFMREVTVNDSRVVEFDVQRFAVVKNARLIEMIGYPISLTCVLASLFIFCYFRSLRRERTTIHIHLFSAIALMTLCKTIEITDQHFSGYTSGTMTQDTASVRTSKPLCEILTILIEYSRTAMFMWMFLEGLYMHNLVAWHVYRSSRQSNLLFCAAGWGFPALLVAIWAPLIEFVWMEQQRMHMIDSACWFHHTNSKYYNILEIPRMSFLAVNLGFLINIIRVLLTKLQASQAAETVQIRKAIKAAIILVPLLGIIHLLWVFSPTTNVPFGWLVSWLYFMSFILSFEGALVSLLYCFLSGEVQTAVKGVFKTVQPKPECEGTEVSLLQLQSAY